MVGKRYDWTVLQSVLTERGLRIGYEVGGDGTLFRFRLSNYDSMTRSARDSECVEECTGRVTNCLRAAISDGAVGQSFCHTPKADLILLTL